MSFLADVNNLHRDRNLYFPTDLAALALAWNPLSVNTQMVLSQGNRLATGLITAVTNVASNSQTLHTRAAGGKYYSEIIPSLFNPDPGGTSPPCYGIAPADCGDGVNTYAGNLVYVFSGHLGFSGAARPVVSPNDVVMIAVDFTAQKFWLGLNGAWVNGGDPAAGTLPDLSAIPVGTYRTAAMGLALGAGNNNQWLSKFGIGQFSFTPPTGFAPWG